MPKISPAAQRAHVHERKTQILTAAAQVFADKGFERATIADIARVAGLAEGSIYNYFKNKGDLLVSIPRQIVQPPIETIGAEFAKLSEGERVAPDQMLTLIARTMLATVHHNAHIFRVLLSALPTMKPAAREKYAKQVITYVVGILEAYFQEQVAHGLLRADLNFAIATRAFIGMFFPFILLQEVLQLKAAGRFEYDDVVEQAVEIFLHGALSPAPRRVGDSRSPAKQARGRLRAKKGKTK